MRRTQLTLVVFTTCMSILCAQVSAQEAAENPGVKAQEPAVTAKSDELPELPEAVINPSIVLSDELQ